MKWLPIPLWNGHTNPKIFTIFLKCKANKVFYQDYFQWLYTFAFPENYKNKDEHINREYAMTITQLQDSIIWENWGMFFPLIYFEYLKL
jgi:hypothetical protein